MKKLTLKKITVAKLDETQMVDIKGASVGHATCVCAETISCSLFHMCCDPETLLQGEG